MKAVTGKRHCQAGGGKRMALGSTSGSHHIFTMEGRLERLVIPIHGNQTLKIGLQRSLMNIIPVTDDEL